MSSSQIKQSCAGAQLEAATSHDDAAGDSASSLETSGTTRSKVIGTGESAMRPAFYRVPSAFQLAIDRAIEHVAAFGETFSLPSSFEYRVIDDRRADVRELIAGIYLGIGKSREVVRILREVLLLPVDDSGFRPITQLDPVWNVYLLALVLAVAPEIERARVSSQSGVHSFRFVEGRQPHLFDSRIGWKSFVAADRRMSGLHKYVLSADISSFSQQICHHRLGLALDGARAAPEISERILHTVGSLADGVPRGLPVGGPASLLLGELLLDSTDQMLQSAGIVFLRYIDDFRIYANGHEEAQRALYLLTSFLWSCEGLTLNKSKTRILRAEEHLSSIPGGRVEGSHDSTDSDKLLALSLWREPQPGGGLEIDAVLHEQIRNIDCVAVLHTELLKKRMRAPLMKRLVRLVGSLEPDARDQCFNAFAENLPRLGPHFHTIMQAFISLKRVVDTRVAVKLSNAITDLFTTESYICAIPANQMWAVRALADQLDSRSEQSLLKVYAETPSTAVRREIAMSIVIAGRGDNAFRTLLRTASDWERRAAIVAHASGGVLAQWPAADRLTPFEQIVWRWAAERRVGISLRLAGDKQCGQAGADLLAVGSASTPLAIDAEGHVEGISV